MEHFLVQAVHAERSSCIHCASCLPVAPSRRVRRRAQRRLLPAQPRHRLIGRVGAMAAAVATALVPPWSAHDAASSADAAP